MAQQVIQWISVAMGGNQSQAENEPEPHAAKSTKPVQEVQYPQEPAHLAALLKARASHHSGGPPPQNEPEPQAANSMRQPVQDPGSQPPGLATPTAPPPQLAAGVQEAAPPEGAAAAPPPPGSAWAGYKAPPPPPPQPEECQDQLHAEDGSEVRPSPETRMTRMVILINFGQSHPSFPGELGWLKKTGKSQIS